MADKQPGANDSSLKALEALLNEDEGQATPPATPEATPGATPAPTAPAAPAQGATTPEPAKESETQAFARRLKEATEKAKAEEREKIAKSLGKQSYAELLAERERKAVEEKGLDPEAFKPLFEKMYEDRIQADPRFKELDEYKAAKAKEWGEAQIAELSKLTGGKITKLEQLDEATLKRGQAEGSFVSAYMALHGAKLLEEVRVSKAAEQQKNSTQHLVSPTGQVPPTAFRNPDANEARILAQFAQFSPVMEKDLEAGKIKIQKEN